MTHEAGVDDGDLEIEEWEKADAGLAAQGYTPEDRRMFWLSVRSPDAIEHERLIGAVQEEHNCGEEEARRILYALNGHDL